MLKVLPIVGDIIAFLTKKSSVASVTSLRTIALGVIKLPAPLSINVSTNTPSLVYLFTALLFPSPIKISPPGKKVKPSAKFISSMKMPIKLPSLSNLFTEPPL